MATTGTAIVNTSKSFPVAVQQTPNDGGFDIGAMLSVLLRRKWYVVFWTVLGIAAGVYFLTQVAVEKFTARTSIVLLEREQNIVDIESVVSDMGSDDASIMTEAEVLRGRDLIGQLVDTLDLTDDPEFNWTLRSPPLLSPGRIIELVAGPQDPGPALSERAIRDITIDAVLDTVSITNVSNTYVFRITAETWDAEKSARITDMLAELYIANQVDQKLEITERATQWLADRASELQIKLEVDKNAVNSFLTETDLVSAEDLAGLNRQSKSFRQRLEELREQGVQLNARIAAFETAMANGDPAGIAAMSEDPLLERLAAEAAVDAAIRTSFDARATQVRDQLALDQSRTEAQIGAVSTSLDDINSRIAKQSQDLLTLQQLEREAEATRLIYEYFLSRLNEASVQGGIQEADSRMLSAAVIPLEASSPKKALILIASAFLGLMLGSLLVLRGEARKQGFRTAREAEDVVGLPVFGQIPQAPKKRRLAVMKYAISNPASALLEAVRNLRTSLLLSNSNTAPQVIMITSALPDEGKSSQTMLLAHTFAQSGRKVIVIECDTRRRALREFFERRDVTKKPGLYALASGKASFEEAVITHDEAKFDMILGTEIEENPADFFMSKRFTDILTEARARYDVVFLDVPPVLVVSDARTIGRYADAILFAVRWDSTHRNSVLDGVDSLRQFGLKVHGLILTQIDPKGLRKYGQYGEYIADYSYGAKYHKN